MLNQARLREMALDQRQAAQHMLRAHDLADSLHVADPILHGQNYRLRSHHRWQYFRRGGHIVRFNAKQKQVNRTDLSRIIRDLDRFDNKIAVRAVYVQTIFAKDLQVLALINKGDIAARARQLPADIAPHRSSPHHADFHRFLLILVTTRITAPEPPTLAPFATLSPASVGHLPPRADEGNTPQAATNRRLVGLPVLPIAGAQ